MTILKKQELVEKENITLSSGDYAAIRDWLSLNLYNAFSEARKGKLGTVNEQRFEINRELEIELLTTEIINRTYSPSPSVAFIITKPVPREIFAATFRDRLVHHFLIQQNGDFWDKRLSGRSFSCRNGKGTLFAIRTLEKDVRNATSQWQESAWAMKIDLQGYFMSLPREYLYKRVCWGLSRQFPSEGVIYDLCKFLWKEVIFDDPVAKVNIKGSLSDWDVLPPSKSMFNSKPNHGIVIGNLTSQWLSNIALDPLDRYVQFELGCKKYGRYVDDAYFISPNKQDLIEISVKVEKFVNDLGLKIHPKKFFLQPVNLGIPFLGVVLYPGYILVGKRVRKNTNELKKEILKNGLTEQRLNSLVVYGGLVKHYNYETTLNRVFGKQNLSDWLKWH